MNKKSLCGRLYPQKLRTNHLFKIMRITFLLAFISVFSLNAKDVHSQNARVTLSQTNSPLEVIINEIETQTDYLFIVNSSIDTNKRVSIKVKNAPVHNVLNQLLKGTNISYSTEGSYIILSQNKSQTDKDEPMQEVKEVIITGKIIDALGEPLIGVNVVLKGSTAGTISDIDGNYSLKVPEGKGEIQFSYIGYRNVVLPIGNKTVINVTMEEDSKVLGEVVVTALGIEKKAESLTYATQKVGGDELTRAKDANFINALQGKTAGLVITPNSTGAGGSSKLLLRGNASVLGENSPLIVMDGVPMASPASTQITDALLSGGNTTDGGDILSNINPDDIENITVLKGANAAALYGSAAANGVLMITTKKGKEGKASISVSSSTLFETPLVTPKFQNIFGADVESYNDTSLNPNQVIAKRRLGNYSWGSRIGRLSGTTLAEIPYARNSAVDNVSSFLETGTNFNNSISASFGSEKVNNYISYGNTTSKGMIPNNKFNRHNLTFRQGMKLFKDRVEINLSVSYVYQESKNRPGSGIYGNPLYDLYLLPRNADISYFKDNSEVYGQLYYIQGIYDENNKIVYPKASTSGPIQQWPWINEENRNSPYWYMNRLQKNSIRERIYGTLGLKVNILEGLSAQARFRADRIRDTNETKTYQGTKAKTLYNSIYEYSRNNVDMMYADFLISYNKRVNNLDLSANFGGSTEKEDLNDVGWNYWMRDSTSIPNVFDPSNIITNKKDGTSLPVTKSKDQNWTNSIYGTFSLGYKEMIYLDASFRTDWSRVYTQFEMFDAPSHYTYYSVGGNAILNRLFKLESDVLNHSKLRISYSEVGNSIPNYVYGAVKQNISSGTIEASQYRTFRNPKPETVRSTEAGIDLRLFRNMIDFDFTFYNSKMLNQWLPKPAATGGTLPLNSGLIRNRGIETTLAYNFTTPDNKFTWRTAFNYSFNQNKILETYGDNKNEMIEQDPVYNGGLKLRYEVGKPYGELYGKTFQYGADGKIKTDSQGIPMLTKDYNCYLGNANSPHHLGWSNTFTYKNFSLFFLIDGKIGGNVISYTEALLDAYGVSERSGEARLTGITYQQRSAVGGVEVMLPVPGIVMPDGEITSVQGYYQRIGLGQPALSEYTYSATNFRLREASVGYTFRNLFGSGNHLNVSFVARNLFFLLKKSPVDPDVSVSTAHSYGGIEAFSLPTTRSFGLNLKATF